MSSPPAVAIIPGGRFAAAGTRGLKMEYKAVGEEAAERDRFRVDSGRFGSTGLDELVRFQPKQNISHGLSYTFWPPWN